MTDFDVCVVGSGAGGGPVAWALADAGYRVVVLEKGPWRREAEITKDEIGEVRRAKWTPRAADEPHVLETPVAGKAPRVERASFWNGVAVGGATNVMSGFFLRMKPQDFRLRSTYGAAPGADVVDWPISYDDLEPYYARVEEEVGVSGRVVPHPGADKRSTPDFPLPPTNEHPVSARIDEAAKAAGVHSLPLPRAVLSRDRFGRRHCDYNGHCGSYGCATRAKGSARVAFVERAVETGRCEVRPRSTVTRLESDAAGRVTTAHYRDEAGAAQKVDARVFVVACQAIETSRLLLLSTGAKHPNGLGNSSGLLGRAILFSPAGSGFGELPHERFERAAGALWRDVGLFVNRTIPDWYELPGAAGERPRKGGAVDFLIAHPNPIASTMALATWDRVEGTVPIWGRALKEKMARHFRRSLHLKFETFTDWMPMLDCRVVLDPDVKDAWGRPVARLRLAEHASHVDVPRTLCERASDLMRRMGAEEVRSFADGSPSTNLQAGGCRFGKDPKTSVLDPDCRSHDADNLYVTDGSFLPTGGSVPYTFTIYANALRVADRLVARLGGRKGN